MAISYFVKPESRLLRLDLEGGETLTVRRRLNAGEQRAMYARMYVAGIDGRLKVNPLETGMATITAYLLDWTLTDDDGAPVEIQGMTPEELTGVLNNLDPDTFGAIRAAIEMHEAQEEKTRIEEKKLRASLTASSAT